MLRLLLLLLLLLPLSFSFFPVATKRREREGAEKTSSRPLDPPPPKKKRRRVRAGAELERVGMRGGSGKKRGKVHYLSYSLFTFNAALIHIYSLSLSGWGNCASTDQKERNDKGKRAYLGTQGVRVMTPPPASGCHCIDIRSM